MKSGTYVLMLIIATMFLVTMFLGGCAGVPPKTAADLQAQISATNELAENALECAQLGSESPKKYKKKVADGVVTEEGTTFGYNVRTACVTGNEQMGENWQVPRPHFRQSQVPIYSGGGYGYGGY